MKNDANDILQQSGSDELLTQTLSAGNEAEAENFAASNSGKPANEIDALVNSFQTTADYFRNDFQRDIDRMKKFANRKTGFENLDEHQILAPGLYILGGLTGTGKTAFALQMASQFANAGENVLYVSNEMDPLTLHSRNLARELYLRDAQPKLTTAQIRQGVWTPTLKDIICEQEKIRNRRVVYTAATYEKLIPALERYAGMLSKPPVIFLDYLQRASLEARTDRFEAVSRISYGLKEFSNKTNATVIALSSINRGNYSAPGAEESFKMSGDIEYSADGLWLLQLFAIYHPSAGSAKFRQVIQNAKKHQPREMEFCCIKNRNGSPYNIYFNYFSRYEYFEPFLDKPKEYHFGDDFDPANEFAVEDEDDEDSGAFNEDSADEDISLPF